MFDGGKGNLQWISKLGNKLPTILNWEYLWFVIGFSFSIYHSARNNSKEISQEIPKFIAMKYMLVMAILPIDQ